MLCMVTIKTGKVKNGFITFFMGNYFSHSQLINKVKVGVLVNVLLRFKKYK